MDDLGPIVAGSCRPMYGSVTAEWNSRKEFTYQWRRSGDSIHITIPDYLDTAPDDVLREFVAFVCRKSRGSQEGFPADVRRYLMSDGYITGKRPVYLSRSRNLAMTSAGDNYDLCDSVQRLLDSGLLVEADVDNAYISWTLRDSVRRVGFCSTMFRVVGVSARLDSPDLADCVRDYVVYHECLHLRQGRMGARGHDPVFRAWERSFPGWRDIERTLSGLGRCL